MLMLEKLFIGTFILLTFRSKFTRLTSSEPSQEWRENINVWFNIINGENIYGSENTLGLIDDDYRR